MLGLGSFVPDIDMGVTSFEVFFTGFSFDIVKPSGRDTIRDSEHTTSQRVGLGIESFHIDMKDVSRTKVYEKKANEGNCSH